MQRRPFLRATGAAVGLTMAGCLGDSDPTALDPPDHGVDSESLPFPAYGQRLPESTLPSPLHDRDVTTTEYLSERETLLTFVFTRCPGPCHSLTANLAHVQVDAAENGYTDEVVLMPVTFDPEYDTPDRIREFSESNGADPTAENWQFLRPESRSAAERVVGETFGVGYEEVPVEEADHEDHGEDDHDHDAGDHEEEPPETTFMHGNLLLLVNRDGYVERAYAQQPPRPDEVLDDLATVRDRFA